MHAAPRKPAPRSAPAGLGRRCAAAHVAGRHASKTAPAPPTAAVLQRVGEGGEHAKLHGIVVTRHAKQAALGDVDVVHLRLVKGCGHRFQSELNTGWKLSLGMSMWSTRGMEGRFGETDCWFETLFQVPCTKQAGQPTNQGTMASRGAARAGGHVVQHSHAMGARSRTSMSDTAVRSLQHQLTCTEGGAQSRRTLMLCDGSNCMHAREQPWSAPPPARP